mmetsp:Transcript_22615/g.64175  ORF Transcript_22615/g.64175 Transcript_22615/m.64175 type:complete len:435 (+) Transcript_22615:102-1406(+)
MHQRRARTRCGGALRSPRFSDEVGDVHGHFLDLRVVVALDVLHRPHVRVRHEVDGDTLPAEAAAAADAVEVVLHVLRQVVVDHQGHLLHVDAAREEIRGDEHARGARAELAHDEVALLLVQVRMHRRDSEVALLELVREEVDLAARVAVDDRLCDCERLVEVTQCVEFPLFLLDRHIKLADTLESQLVLLHQDADGVAHELRGQVEDLGRHGGREQADLDVRRQGLEDVVDLVLEATGQHLIGLVQDESDEVVHQQAPLADHVVHAPRGADDDVLPVPQAVYVVAHRGATDAGVAADLHVVPKREGHLLDLVGQLACGRQDQGLADGLVHVDALEHADHEGGGLARAGLCLTDRVAPIQDRLDATLLDRAGLLEAVGVDPTEQVLVQIVVVERLKNRVLLRTRHRHSLGGHSDHLHSARGHTRNPEGCQRPPER